MSMSIPPSGPFSQINPPMQNGCGSPPKPDPTARQATVEEALEQLGNMWEPPGKDSVPPSKLDDHGHSHGSGAGCGHDKGVPGGKLPPGLGTLPPGWQHSHPHTPVAGGSTAVAGVNQLGQAESLMKALTGLIDVLKQLAAAVQAMKGSTPPPSSSSSGASTPPSSSSSSSSPTVPTPPSPPTNIPVS